MAQKGYQNEKTQSNEGLNDIAENDTGLLKFQPVGILTTSSSAVYGIRSFAATSSEHPDGLSALFCA